MKNISFLLLVVLFASCKQASETKTESIQPEVRLTTSKIFPETISKVLQAHGGLDAWNKMQSLEFTMEKPNGNEVTTTDLKTRKSLISMPNHTIGYNGEAIWLHKKDTVSYKGNPKFYYNLMFYFYAMPFVLADDGILYNEVEPLVFEDKSYPGIKISYNTGVGESPDDEYILYYDSETNRMAWLGYTVTYFSKEKGKEYHFIEYSNWQTIEGLLLPETLTWYNYENNLPTTKRSDRVFTNVVISKGKRNDSMFEMLEGAEVID